MRKLGLGVKHDFITTNTTFSTRVLGKILIDVEDSGKAYYIYPKDKKGITRKTIKFNNLRM